MRYVFCDYLPKYLCPVNKLLSQGSNTFLVFPASHLGEFPGRILKL